MTIVRSTLIATFVALVLPGAQGCIFVDDDDDIAYGTLTIEWSIDGYVDPSDCDIYRADYLEVAIFDSRGNSYTEIEAPCDDFGVSIDLPDGVYDVDATLIDDADRAATTTLSISADIRGGTELVLPVDFPARSFL